MVWSNTRRANRPALLVLVAGALLILGTSTSFMWDPLNRESMSDWIETYRQPDAIVPASHGALQAWGHRASLKHNLRPDKHYLLSFASAGWSNQVIAFIKAMHLAHMTGRIPILTPFISKTYHNGVGGLELRVGDVFDLSRLSAALGGHPILDFDDLKGTLGSPPIPADEQRQLRKDARKATHGWYNGTIFDEEPETEQLGCWGFWPAAVGRTSADLDQGRFGLDLSWTPLPFDRFFYDNGLHVTYEQLATVLTPNQEPNLDQSHQWIQQHGLPEPVVAPEDRVACLDETFYAKEDLNDLWGFASGRAAWGSIGTHLRWHPNWERIAQEYLRNIFGVAEGEETPLYIAVHIRRGDFQQDWHNVSPRDWAFGVHSLQNDLQERKGLEVRKVLITTNEKDPNWLSQFDGYDGFHVVNHDHLGTNEWDPVWAPTVLDSIFLSSGVGFIGFLASTMSIIAERRVIEWHDGLGNLVGPNLRAPDGWEYPYLVNAL